MTIERGKSRYEEAEYVLSCFTDEGLRSKIHVMSEEHDGRAVYTILPKGDPPYGIAAFYLYVSAYHDTWPVIGERVSGDDWDLNR